MPPKPFRVHTVPEKLRLAFGHLAVLRLPNGLFLAAPEPPYDAFWWRDTLYCVMADVRLGLIAEVYQTLATLFAILQRYSSKIDRCIHRWPGDRSAVLHPRLQPFTLDEFPDKWGHHQLDAIGLFLLVVARLMQAGIRVIRSLDDAAVLRNLILYLYSARWDSLPDFGVWEEPGGPDGQEELKASSLGHLIAGLGAWCLDDRLSEQVPVPDRMLEEGWAAIMRILSHECHSRPVDLAQLSLIWPGDIFQARPQLEREILANVERSLIREHGVMRYRGDRYEAAPDGSEAQWPLGLAFLSIIYSRYARRAAGSPEQADYLARARGYLEHLERLADPRGRIPELYRGGTPRRLPLAWAQAGYLIALLDLQDAAAAVGTATS